MKTIGKISQVIAVVAAVIGLGGASWFLFFGGGYDMELWTGRFDQAVWLENKKNGSHSPRRPMAKSLMRQLPRGTPREKVEALIGPAAGRIGDWHIYDLGWPRWGGFAMDEDVFEVRYEDERLVETRIRST